MLSGCCSATSVLNEAQGQRQSEFQGVLLLQWPLCRCVQTSGVPEAAPRLGLECLILMLCLNANCAVFFSLSRTSACYLEEKLVKESSIILQGGVCFSP